MNLHNISQESLQFALGFNEEINEPFSLLIANGICSLAESTFKAFTAFL